MSFIEDESLAGWPTLTPSTGTLQDQAAFVKLRQAMRERRDARVDPKLTALISRISVMLDLVPKLILREAAGRAM